MHFERRAPNVILSILSKTKRKTHGIEGYHNIIQCNALRMVPAVHLPAEFVVIMHGSCLLDLLVLGTAHVTLATSTGAPHFITSAAHIVPLGAVVQLSSNLRDMRLGHNRSGQVFESSTSGDTP